jgi:CBS domain-containing protein
MRSDIITADQDETMDKVARLMAQWKVTVLVVTDASKPVGVITEKDILAQLVAEDLKPSDVQAEDIMSSPIITISGDETVSDALDRMMEFDVSRRQWPLRLRRLHEHSRDRYPIVLQAGTHGNPSAGLPCL